MSKQYQNGLWIVKVVFYAAFVTGALFLPFELVAGYVWVARVGASVFAVLQMVVIIDLAYQVNDYMVEASQASGGYGEGSAATCGLDDSLATLVGFALLLFAAALKGLVCLFVFFSECATTTAFVAMTLVLCVAVCATQLALSESGNLLTPRRRRRRSSSAATSGAELVPTKDGDDDEESAKSELGPAPMDCLDGGDRDGARFNLALALVSMYAACTLTNWGTWEAANGGKVAPLAGLVSMWLNIAAQCGEARRGAADERGRRGRFPPGAAPGTADEGAAPSPDAARARPHGRASGPVLGG
ncbi:serine protease inhibitor [Aureococcus anophagefferens]|uniref:Serine protease inhibitor n=1 Tax=Aureococcus anophagefferens TaxID=44056 RepID=A0ABR1G3C0_AURAN